MFLNLFFIYRGKKKFFQILEKKKFFFFLSLCWLTFDVCVPFLNLNKVNFYFNFVDFNFFKFNLFIEKLKGGDSIAIKWELKIPYLLKGVCLKTYFLYIKGEKIFFNSWKKKFIPFITFVPFDGSYFKLIRS
jgi:hypothetical protein